MAEKETRIDELDGLRGLAVGLVFLFHCILESLAIENSPITRAISYVAAMGWAGVDLFLVLSGFLITSILIENRAGARYFAPFYARRALRIFPLYYLVLGGLFLLLPQIDPAGWANTLSYQGWYLLFAQNWIYALGLDRPARHLGHFWSLAIEEQFYLVWPLIVRFLRPQMLVGVCAAVIILTPLYRLGLALRADTIVEVQAYLHFATLTRFDSLMAGALLALAIRSPTGRRWLDRLAWPGLGLGALGVGLCIAGNPRSPLWENLPMVTVGYTALALLGSAAVGLAIVAKPDGLYRRFWRLPPLIALGRYSYAFYLLHWPIILILKQQFLDRQWRGPLAWLLFVLLCAVLSFVWALCSWHLIEKHALALKRYAGWATPPLTQRDERAPSP